MKRALLLVPVTAAALVLAMASPAVYAAGGSNVIYASIVRPLPGNVPSVGAESSSFT
jgi:hypothetical protein